MEKAVTNGSVFKELKELEELKSRKFEAEKLECEKRIQETRTRMESELEKEKGAMTGKKNDALEKAKQEAITEAKKFFEEYKKKKSDLNQKYKKNVKKATDFVFNQLLKS